MRKIIRYLVIVAIIFAVLCLGAVCRNWDVLTAALAESVYALLNVGLYAFFVILGISILVRIFLR